MISSTTANTNKVLPIINGLSVSAIESTGTRSAAEAYSLLSVRVYIEVNLIVKVSSA